MTKKAKIEIAVMAIMLFCIFMAMIVASAAWFNRNQVADSHNATLESSKSSGFGYFIPDNPTNTNLYSGETGVQYIGADAPYTLHYSPVFISADGISLATPLTTELLGIDITLAGTDSLGNPIQENYLANTEKGDKFLSEFCVRLIPTAVSGNNATNIELNTQYKKEGKYWVSEVTKKPLLIKEGDNVLLDMNVIFQSEEKYALIQSTQSDIDASNAVPLSNPKYMYSKMKLHFQIGVAKLINIYFDAKGGVSDTSVMQATGSGTVVLPKATMTDYEFLGWYLDAAYSVQFTPDYLVASPTDKDFTVYAKYRENPTVTFNYTLTGYSPQTNTVRVLTGKTVAEPTAPTAPVGVYGTFLGWATQAPAAGNYDETYARSFLAANAYDFNAPVNENTTLYAVWFKNKFSVVIHLEQGGYAYEGTLIKHTASGTSEQTGTVTLTVWEGETLGQYFDTAKPEYYTIEGQRSMKFKKLSTTVSKSLVTYNDVTAYNMSLAITAKVELYAYYSLI